MTIPVAEPVPIWVKDRNAWAGTVGFIAFIGAVAWIVTSALNGGTPSGSATQYQVVSDPPTQTPWVVTSTPSPTPAMTATARVVTATPTPTTESLNCNRAMAGQTCTRYPGVSTATNVPKYCSEIPDTVGVPVTCRKDDVDTQGGQVTE